MNVIAHYPFCCWLMQLLKLTIFCPSFYVQQQIARTGRRPTGNISCPGFVEDDNTLVMLIIANKLNENVDYEYVVCKTANGREYKLPMADEKFLKELLEVKSSSTDKLNYYSTTMLYSTKALIWSDLKKCQIPIKKARESRWNLANTLKIEAYLTSVSLDLVMQLPVKQHWADFDGLCTNSRMCKCLLIKWCTSVSAQIKDAWYVQYFVILMRDDQWYAPLSHLPSIVHKQP